MNLNTELLNELLSILGPNAKNHSGNPLTKNTVRKYVINSLNVYKTGKKTHLNSAFNKILGNAKVARLNANVAAKIANGGNQVAAANNALKAANAQPRSKVANLNTSVAQDNAAFAAGNGISQKTLNANNELNKVVAARLAEIVHSKVAGTVNTSTKVTHKLNTTGGTNAQAAAAVTQAAAAVTQATNVANLLPGPAAAANLIRANNNAKLAIKVANSEVPLVVTNNVTGIRIPPNNNSARVANIARVANNNANKQLAKEQTAITNVLQNPTPSAVIHANNAINNAQAATMVAKNANAALKAS